MQATQFYNLLESELESKARKFSGNGLFGSLDYGSDSGLSNFIKI